MQLNRSAKFLIYVKGRLGNRHRLPEFGNRRSEFGNLRRRADRRGMEMSFRSPKFGNRKFGNRHAEFGKRFFCRTPLFPYLPVGRFHGTGKGFGIAQRRQLHLCAQIAADLTLSGNISCEPDCCGNIGIFAVGDISGHSDSSQNTCSDA